MQDPSQHQALERDGAATSHPRVGTLTLQVLDERIGKTPGGCLQAAFTCRPASCMGLRTVSSKTSPSAGSNRGNQVGPPSRISRCPFTKLCQLTS
jgi:hypothetical protein